MNEAALPIAAPVGNTSVATPTPAKTDAALREQLAPTYGAKPSVIRVLLGSINFAESRQVRANINEDVVAEYSDAILSYHRGDGGAAVDGPDRLSREAQESAVG